MTRIAVDPGALDAWAADAARMRTRLADSLAHADVVVARLDARWDGTASELFADRYADWRAATDRLTCTLDQLVTLVDAAHTNYRSAAVANDHMWPSAVPVIVAMSAAAVGIDADPDDFRATAAVLAGQGARLDAVWHALGTALAGTGGMAGADAPGVAFGRDHDALVTALWSGWAAARDVVRALADTVAATGDNLLRAERASTADAADPPEPLPRSSIPAPPPPAPPAATGAAGAFDAWPTGDPDRLAAAAQAWRQAATALTDVSTATTSAVRRLTAVAAAPSLDRLQTYVDAVVRDECVGGFFATVRTSCEQLARTCELLGEQIVRTRRALRDAAASLATGDEWYDPVALLLDATVARGVAGRLAAGADLVLLHGAVELARAQHERAVADLRDGLVATAGTLATESAALTFPEPSTAEVTPVNPPDPATGSSVALGPGVRTIDPPPLLVARGQIEKKYDQHAAAFGVTEPRGRDGFVLLESELRAFAVAADTVHVDGTYRGQQMIIHFDPGRDLVLLQKPDGAFVSGWVLTADQERNIVERGSL